MFRNRHLGQNKRALQGASIICSCAPHPVFISLAVASTAFAMNDPGKRFFNRRKEFQYKHGQRLHPYDNDKAPYPLSYNKHVLEMSVLSLAFTQRYLSHFKG